MSFLNGIDFKFKEYFVMEDLLEGDKTDKVLDATIDGHTGMDIDYYESEVGSGQVSNIPYDIVL